LSAVDSDLGAPLAVPTPTEPPTETATNAGASRAGGRVARWLAPESPVPVYVGVGLIALGFSLIAYTWGRVAGTLSVALQLPYVISGGLTGLALVVVGATVISVATKRRDAVLRARQLDELSEVLRLIASAAAARPPRRRAGR
jgi:cytochrome c biogenesis protein CcdA